MRLNRSSPPNNKKSTICCRPAETTATVAEMETFRAGDKDEANNFPGIRDAEPAVTEAANKVSAEAIIKTRVVTEIRVQTPSATLRVTVRLSEVEVWFHFQYNNET